MRRIGAWKNAYSRGFGELVEYKGRFGYRACRCVGAVGPKVIQVSRRLTIPGFTWPFRGGSSGGRSAMGLRLPAHRLAPYGRALFGHPPCRTVESLSLRRAERRRDRTLIYHHIVTCFGVGSGRVA